MTMGRFTAASAAIYLVLLAGSCGRPEPEPEPVSPETDDLEILLSRLIGSFSSAEQAAEDEDYLDIRLETVPIWPERQDGYWLYVEQAAATALDRPYRQRVYRLTRLDDQTLQSEVFTFEGDPLVHAGAWGDEEPLADLGPGDLELRGGCTVYLYSEPDGRFTGGTRGKGCESTRAGASYATSEVVVYEDRLETWDRGYDAEGNQVWGAEKGPYVFRRVMP